MSRLGPHNTAYEHHSSACESCANVDAGNRGGRCRWGYLLVKRAYAELLEKDVASQ
jgi:hypothetical protein